MRQPDVYGAKRFVRPVALGAVSGVVACVLLLILMSIIMGIQDVPQSIVALISTVIFVLGGFVAGYACSVCARERGMMLGLCCGVCLFCILSVASLAVPDGNFGMLALTKLVAVLLASALGGIVGVNKRKKFR